MKRTIVAMIMAALLLMAAVGCASSAAPATNTEAPKTEASEAPKAAEPEAPKAEAEAPKAEEPKTEAPAQENEEPATESEPAEVSEPEPEPAAALEPFELHYDVEDEEAPLHTTLTFDPNTKTVHVSADAATLYLVEQDVPYTVENGKVAFVQTQTIAKMAADKLGIFGLFLPTELDAFLYTPDEDGVLHVLFGDPDNAEMDPSDLGTFEMTADVLRALGVQ